MKNLPALFEDHQIRRTYDETTATWWFSMVDIVHVLTQQPDYQSARKHWKVQKSRLQREGNKRATNCHQLKMIAEDGKQRFTDVATADTLQHLIQSIPGPKAESIKLWLAKAGYERMQEIADPALSLVHATGQQHGRSDNWIRQRMTGQKTFNKPVPGLIEGLANYWAFHAIEQGE